MLFDYRASVPEWEAAHRPTWAEISLDAVAENTRRLAALARPAELMAVVKADAYGHGAVETARAALAAGATWLGVATLEEAIQLRREGLTAPVLIMGPSSPAQARSIVEHDVTAAVFEMGTAEALAAAARRAGRTARAHLKVDTGMSRIGVSPDAEGVRLAAKLAALDGLVLDGVYTHYAGADEKDKTSARRQTDLFRSFLDLAAGEGLRFRWRHAANSAALLDLPETRFDLVRTGISLYGLYPSEEVDRSRVELLPAMAWKTRLMHVKRVPAGTPVSYGGEYVTTRPTLIGTCPVGYADGYRRALAGRGRVLVQGWSCPVLGRVNMDHIMVGLEAVPGARPGDEAVLLGPSAGEARITAEELAGHCGTIAYEIVSTVGRRVPRVYLRGGRPVAARSILGPAPSGGGLS
ncbi:MAG: alanine racemase [Bacillota bacterium]